MITIVFNCKAFILTIVFCKQPFFTTFLLYYSSKWKKCATKRNHSFEGRVNFPMTNTPSRLWVITSVLMTTWPHPRSWLLPPARWWWCHTYTHTLQVPESIVVRLWKNPDKCQMEQWDVLVYSGSNSARRRHFRCFPKWK